MHTKCRTELRLICLGRWKTGEAKTYVAVWCRIFERTSCSLLRVSVNGGELLQNKHSRVQQFILHNSLNGSIFSTAKY